MNTHSTTGDTYGERVTAMESPLAEVAESFSALSINQNVERDDTLPSNSTRPGHGSIPSRISTQAPHSRLARLPLELRIMIYRACTMWRDPDRVRGFWDMSDNHPNIDGSAIVNLVRAFPEFFSELHNLPGLMFRGYGVNIHTSEESATVQPTIRTIEHLLAPKDAIKLHVTVDIKTWELHSVTQLLNKLKHTHHTMIVTLSMDDWIRNRAFLELNATARALQARGGLLVSARHHERRCNSWLRGTHAEETAHARNRHNSFPDNLLLIHPQCRTCKQPISSLSIAKHDYHTYMRSTTHALSAPNGRRVKLVSLEEAQQTQMVLRDEALTGSLYEWLERIPGIREVRIEDGLHGGAFKVEVLTRESVAEREIPRDCGVCGEVGQCRA